MIREIEAPQAGDAVQITEVLQEVIDKLNEVIKEINKTQKMALWKTVRRGLCFRCSNSWWFDKPFCWECTTCQHWENKSEL
jgi:hypothetical protein